MGLPPGFPGFRDVHVYPLVPDLASARRLAGSGHRDADLYCVLEGGGPRAAQIIKNNLAAIGIDVHVHCMPGDAFFIRMFLPNEPWDIAIHGYGANYNDPGEFINGFATDDDVQLHPLPRPESQPRDPRRLTPLRHSPRPAYAKIDLRSARHGSADQLRQRNRTGLLLPPHRLPALPADGRHGSRRPLHPDRPVAPAASTKGSYVAARGLIAGNTLGSRCRLGSPTRGRTRQMSARAAGPDTEEVASASRLLLGSHSFPANDSGTERHGSRGLEPISERR